MHRLRQPRASHVDPIIWSIIVEWSTTPKYILDWIKSFFLIHLNKWIMNRFAPLFCLHFRIYHKQMTESNHCSVHLLESLFVCRNCFWVKCNKNNKWWINSLSAPSATFTSQVFLFLDYTYLFQNPYDIILSYFIVELSKTTTVTYLSLKTETSNTCVYCCQCWVYFVMMKINVSNFLGFLKIPPPLPLHQRDVLNTFGSETAYASLLCPEEIHTFYIYNTWDRVLDCEVQ